MAGWSTTDWESDSIQAYANEFFLAANERANLLDIAPPFTVPEVGANIQLASVWRDLQDWIATHVWYAGKGFCRSHDDDGTKRAVDFYDGENLDLWSFAELMKAVRGDGSAQSDFRRATTWPSDWTDWDDPAYSVGRIQKDDIMGPWIFEDMQKVLNFLIWGYKVTFFTDATFKFGQAYTKALALAAYNASSSSEIPSYLGGAFSVCDTIGSSTYGYVLSRTAFKAEYSRTLPLAMDVECNFTVRSSTGRDFVDPKVFDSNGDDVIEDKCSIFDTQLVSAGETSKKSILFGSTSAPAWAATDPGQRGWECFWFPHGMIRADVEGGFEYV